MECVDLDPLFLMEGIAQRSQISARRAGCPEGTRPCDVKTRDGDGWTSCGRPSHAWHFDPRAHQSLCYITSKSLCLFVFYSSNNLGGTSVNSITWVLNVYCYDMNPGYLTTPSLCPPSVFLLSYLCSSLTRECFQPSSYKFLHSYTQFYMDFSQSRKRGKQNKLDISYRPPKN